MNRILFLLALLISAGAFSQNMPRRADLQPINAKGYKWLTGAFEAGLYFPQDTLQSADSGAAAIVHNVMYLKNVRRGDSLFWGPLTGGGADSSKFATKYGVDTAKNNIRSICQWPKERPIGILYENGSWVNTNGFTKVGSASLEVNNNSLDLSGGDGTFG